MTSINLNSEIIDKIKLFDKKYKNVFDVLSKELNAEVTESESLSKKTTELQNLYFLFSENTIKSKNNLSKYAEEFEEKRITQTDFEIETMKCSELSQ